MYRAVCMTLALCLSPRPALALRTSPDWAPRGQPQTPPAVTTQGRAQPSALPDSLDLLDQAIRFYRKGDFNGAIQKYKELLQVRPNSPDAYAGLARAYLKKKEVAEAFDATTKGLQMADSPTVRVALGEVYFRQGQIAKAEEEWVKVINSGYQNARAYMGLARVSWALSNYKRGRKMLDNAHDLDPEDPDIRKLWVRRLNRAKRIEYLQQYLVGESNDDAETRASLQQYLEYLKARAKDPRGACHLIGETAGTELKLIPLGEDLEHLRGFGLSVAVNGNKSLLLLDTGSSGVMIDHKSARKAGVTELSGNEIGGIGDKGTKSGHMGLADSLKIGELEFKNCPVEILEQTSVIGHDGLIGADVFAAFLVDIDFGNGKLHLKQLPKRPGEAETVSLPTGWDDSGYSGEEPPGKTSEVSTPLHPGPLDSYVAPEMHSYTKFYRFGHSMLLPTSIGDTPVKLFLLDTGSTSNLISPSAAREVTKIHGDARTIKGLSGSVKNVYRADKAVLRFAHMQQENQDLIAIDMTHISDRIGTEVSGVLGFEVLHLLDIKINYRDGLVDFSLDPKRRYH